MTERVLNFNPGPAALPLPALERAQSELLDFEGTGMSILEHSHRGKDYARVHDEAKGLLRELLGIPDTHEVLFMQGGALSQFALVPMNLLSGDKSADYILTGNWSDKAIAEAQIVGNARVAATTQNDDGVYTRVPKASELDLDSNSAYVHLTSNNTIFGTQFHEFPDTGNVPLVADMSSDILWRPIDVSRFGIIYGGAQKNMGPAGVTVVIIRKDLAENSPNTIPKIFRYSTILKGDSLQNTPPVFPIYMMRNVLSWVKEQGGAAAMQKRNQQKADHVYAAIDANPDFFRSPVDKDSRSVMNIVFRLPKPELEDQFLAEAKEHNMVGLKGHRSVGGIRISLYNAIEPSHVEKLVDFMKQFARDNG
jgi:phosphoserine aminotransferase